MLQRRRVARGRHLPVVAALLWVADLPVARAAPGPVAGPVAPAVHERLGELRLVGLAGVVRSRFKLSNPDREVLDLFGVQPPPAYCASRVWEDARGRVLLRSGWDAALRRWRFVRSAGDGAGADVEDAGGTLVFRGPGLHAALKGAFAPVMMRPNGRTGATASVGVAPGTATAGTPRPTGPAVPTAPPVRLVTRPFDPPEPLATWGPLLPLWQPAPRASVRPIPSVRPANPTPAPRHSMLPPATAAVAVVLPPLPLPPLHGVHPRQTVRTGPELLGPFLPAMYLGPPVPRAVGQPAVGAADGGPHGRALAANGSSRPAWEVVRHGTDDEGEPDVLAQAPWPRSPQRIERLSLRKQRQDTVFEVVAAGALTVWMEAQPRDARWILRFPRAEVPAAPPRPRGATRRLALGRDTRSWILTLELDPGQYDVEETRINDGRGLQLRFHRRRTVPGDRPVVVLDPGHGGADPGARGPMGVTESQVTLDVSRRLRPLLEHAGFHVVPTRTIDAAVRLGDRAALAESLDATALISIHCNSSPLREARGIETWFRHEAGSGLARKVHEALVKATGRPDRGVRQGRLMVLKTPGLPGVLVEIGFLSHPDEGNRLLDEEHQAQMAEGLARGLRLLVESGEGAGTVGRRRLQDQRTGEPKVGALGIPEKAPHRPRG
ncbi:MAG: N-acetylmuramoyl-L-alanine amidase [Candidatus Sericytochromatia bacterium]|nr:N-acetylmuramoyl-L-alanine amidase [Candidatus Sericytochromatia bacterium]